MSGEIEAPCASRERRQQNGTDKSREWRIKKSWLRTIRFLLFISLFFGFVSAKVISFRMWIQLGDQWFISSRRFLTHSLLKSAVDAVVAIAAKIVAVWSFRLLSLTLDTLAFVCISARSLTSFVCAFYTRTRALVRLPARAPAEHLFLVKSAASSTTLQSQLIKYAIIFFFFADNWMRNERWTNETVHTWRIMRALCLCQLKTGCSHTHSRRDSKIFGALRMNWWAGKCAEMRSTAHHYLLAASRALSLSFALWIHKKRWILFIFSLHFHVSLVVFIRQSLLLFIK